MTDPKIRKSKSPIWTRELENWGCLTVFGVIGRADQGIAKRMESGWMSSWGRWDYKYCGKTLRFILYAISQLPGNMPGGGLWSSVVGGFFLTSIALVHFTDVSISPSQHKLGVKDKTYAMNISRILRTKSSRHFPMNRACAKGCWWWKIVFAVDFHGIFISGTIFLV